MSANQYSTIETPARDSTLTSRSPRVRGRHRGPDAEREGDEDGERDGDAGEEKGRRQPLEGDRQRLPRFRQAPVGEGLADAVAERLAEVEGRHAGDEARVLDVQRVLEAHALAELAQVLLRAGFAEDHAGRIADASRGFGLGLRPRAAADCLRMRMATPTAPGSLRMPRTPTPLRDRIRPAPPRPRCRSSPCIRSSRGIRPRRPGALAALRRHAPPLPSTPA